MKLLFGLLFLFVFSNECHHQKSNNSALVQDKVSFTYEATSRGFYEMTEITKDSILFSNDRNLKEVEVSKSNAEDWNELNQLLKEIDVKSLSELEAPTNKHQVDAAAMATFSVKINDDTFETNVFDHGFPPKPISALVNKVLSMKQMMAKH